MQSEYTDTSSYSAVLGSVYFSQSLSDISKLQSDDLILITDILGKAKRGLEKSSEEQSDLVYSLWKDENRNGGS
tara:strand:- start:1017 stop:1238 length:222 start_codon:yes stop_codon:yes gene_type:complete